MRVGVSCVFGFGAGRPNALTEGYVGQFEQACLKPYSSQGHGICRCALRMWALSFATDIVWADTEPDSLNGVFFASFNRV